MSRASEAIFELGRRLGLGELAFEPPEALSLDVAGVGRLSFEAAFGDDLLASLAWPLPPYDRETLPAALELCAPDRRHPRPLKASLFKDDVVLSVLLPESEIAAPELERVMLWLLSLRENLLKR